MEWEEDGKGLKMVFPARALEGQRDRLLSLSQAVGNMLCDFRQLSAALSSLPPSAHRNVGQML